MFCCTNDVKIDCRHSLVIGYGWIVFWKNKFAASALVIVFRVVLKTHEAGGSDAMSIVWNKKVRFSSNDRTLRCDVSWGCKQTKTHAEVLLLMT
jgi:hypothetical protein